MIIFWPQYLSSLGWAEVGSNMKKRRLKSGVWGRKGFLAEADPLVFFFRLLFASTFSSPLLFPSWFSNLFHRFVFTLPRTFKNNYWNHSSPSESFLRHNMNYTAGQTSEGRGPLPSKNGCCKLLWLLVQLSSNSLHMQYPVYVAQLRVRCPASCTSGFLGFESDTDF